MAARTSKAVTKKPEGTGKEESAHLAKVALMASSNAAAVVQAFGQATFGDQDINMLIGELRIKMDFVKNGDLLHCESMLVGQAHALQSIFVTLARRAVNQENMKHYEGFLRMALKAQNQSRMTLETLAAIKNPPIVYARQANINQGGGNQQVNNGTPATGNQPSTRTHAHAGKTINQSNELLEAQRGSEILDSRTTGATSGQDKAMAAVG